MSHKRNDFQVSWHNVNYAIEQRPSFYRRTLNEINRIVEATSKAVSLPRSGSYDLKEKSNIEAGYREDITILQDVNGSFKAGQLVAILGPSGAGKTSLLNFISRRKHENYTGNFIVSQEKLAKKITINAIPQSDHLPEYLSVRENLNFASRLKNPTFNEEEHDKNVTKVSNLLGLNECLETRTKKTSGGQQKRLAIAQELLSRPDVLILDEPTSGLDSLTCLQTLKVLKGLVRASAENTIEPIAVVLTIHQPQREAFDLFDKVYVMATGGRVIYDGPPGMCTRFVNDYSGLELPQGYNPASFLVEIASGELGAKPIEALQMQVEQSFRMQQSNSMAQSCKLEQISQGLFVDPRLVRGTSSGGHFFTKTRALFARFFLADIRKPSLTLMRLFIYIYLPISVFQMMGQEPGEANACPNVTKEYDLQTLATTDQYTSDQRQKEYLLTVENILMLYNMVYACVITKIALVALSFILDMSSSLKELNNGWYSTKSYIVARILADLPLDLLLPTVTVSMTYLLTGQMTGIANGDLAAIYRILLSSFVIFLGVSIGLVEGMILGALYLDDISTVLFVSQAISLPLVMISGVIVRTKMMSNVMKFLSELSLFRHCLDVTFIVRYGFNICPCDRANDFSANVTMTGVPDGFKSLTQVWLNTLEELPDDESNNISATSTNQEDFDVFQMIARQVAQYNTYAMDVNSCTDVIPYQLSEMEVREKDLLRSFLSLGGIYLATVLLLIITVNVMIKHRSSL